MQVCYFFSDISEKAVAALPADVETVDTSSSPHTYWLALCERWKGCEDLLIIEQDIIIHDDVICQFMACDNPWCLFPYVYGAGNSVNISGPMFMTRGLGCTLFRRKLQREMPLTLIFEHEKAIRQRSRCSGNVCSDAAMCWQHIDQTINHVLEDFGHTPHRHSPFVKHDHFDDIAPSGEVISCPGNMVEMTLNVNPR